MANSIQKTQNIGQAIWLDYIRRGMFASGEFQQFIDMGISGVTSNPTIFEKAIVGSTDYDVALTTGSWKGKNIESIYETIAVEDIQSAADLLRPIYDKTDGLHGYASFEVSPLLAFNAKGTIQEARRLFHYLNRPNIMVKVPATTEGIVAIRKLISEGINVNVTLLFSLKMYQQVREAYLSGLEELAQAGNHISRVASVASFFLSRVDSVADGLLEKQIKAGQKNLQNLLGKAAVANAQIAYHEFQETFSSDRFNELKLKGARVQRPLWASTGTKNPNYSDVLYVEPLIGVDSVNTMPPATIDAFLNHGQVAMTIENDVAGAKKVLKDLLVAGIDMDSITSKLLLDGVKSFADSFNKLLSGVDQKMWQLSKEHVDSDVSLGLDSFKVESALEEFGKQKVIRRLWQKDHTVWQPDPKEITNRLGWLTVLDIMKDQLPFLKSFVKEIQMAHFKHVVLLGMGGSSLGPEVLRQTFGPVESFPDLIVLDSINPAAVKAVADSIEPAQTLFIVSSKSGSTIEPNLLMQYFWSEVEARVGESKTNGHFVAITDPGSSLASLAREKEFRHVFLNPSDIGGRYSVLSYFGLVPAALTGVNIEELLDRAETMKESCVSCIPEKDNPGASLGAIMGTLALQGQNKLTLITSSSVRSFGLWAEQLIAESTGKKGTGIVPVAGEPLMEPEQYGNDRLFVFLRNKGDDNSVEDTVVHGLRSSGQPVVVLRLNDKYDIGAEFFRWEFATAVAGAILGINAFDQPNVQQAKDATDHVMKTFESAGSLPKVEVSHKLVDLFTNVEKGDYLAIMVYFHQSPEIDKIICDFRARITMQYGIATTLGYGPRFLHSTGQLHKGGPATGRFLQITVGRNNDITIPGKSYTFGVVADAQALGDLEVLKSLGRPVINLHLDSGEAGVALELTVKLADSV